MATFYLSRPFLVTGSLTFGLGLGLLHSMRARPIQCQYTAPYYNQHASPETGWSLVNVPAAAKQGRTTIQHHAKEEDGGFLTASLMRQVSLGSVLGVVAGLGLRVFSRALVFFLGVGIVLVEVTSFLSKRVVPGGFLMGM